MADAQSQRYVRQKKLGSGGMGEVWLYRDTLLNRLVAVKFVTPTQGRGDHELLLREARLLANLNHPNITAIYDASFDGVGNDFHLIMEYVDGKSLSDLIDNQEPLPLNQILDIAIGILEALHYAHGQDIVHRDIKPSNVLLDQNNEVKLTDFGLAGLISILREEADIPAIGTLSYMSPEQASGMAIDAQADLYSLGVLLFEMVTHGRLPFKYSDPQDMIEAHLHEEPEAVRKYAPHIPAILEYVIMRLLAKKPADRYPSAESVLSVIGAINTGRHLDKPYLQLLAPTTTPLVGREAELKQLESAWTRTQQLAAPCLVVVEGETGIGKSRLVAEFLKGCVVEKGVPVLIGSSDDIDSPYKPYAEIIAKILEMDLVPGHKLADHISILESQLVKLPRVAQMVASSPTTSISHDPRRDQWRFFDAVLQLLFALGPAVIFLENATFLDEASVALTRFLVRRGQHPFLIIAACRNDHGPVVWLRDFLVTKRPNIQLTALEPTAVRHYLMNLMNGPVSDPVVNVVQSRSYGQPLYIEAIVRQLIESGDFYRQQNAASKIWQYSGSGYTGSLNLPLQTVFQQRLERLNGTAQKALAAAAVIGPTFSFEVWLALLGGQLQFDKALNALDEALALRLIQDIGDDNYRFHPPDLIELLINYLSAPRRRFLHRQTAQILDEREAEPSVIAYHYEQAGETEAAAKYLELSGARAMSANAVNEALDFYRRAVALTETVTGYMALGNLYRQKGQAKEAIAMLQRALALAKGSEDILAQANILNRLCFVYWMYDHYQEAVDAARAILTLSPLSAIERGKANSHLGMIFWLTRQYLEAEKYCLRAYELVKDSDDEATLAEIYNRLGLVQIYLCQYAEAEEACRRSLEIRQRLRDYWGQGYCLNNLAKIALDRGEFDKANKLFAAAKALFEKIESQDGLMIVKMNQGDVLLRQGNVKEALSLLYQALDLAEEMDTPSSYLGDIYVLLARANLRLGQFSRTKTIIREMTTLVRARGIRGFSTIGQTVLAQVMMAEGEWETAEKLFEQSLVSLEKGGSPADLIRTRLTYARFLTLRHGTIEEAATLAQAARTSAATIGLYLED